MNFRFLAFNWADLTKGDLSVLTTSTGLIIVFAVLIILTLVIMLLSKLGASKKSENSGSDAEITTSVKSPISSLQTAPSEDDSLIAVIAAAVYAFGESAGRKLAVKSIRRVNARKEGRSVWAASGVYENTRPF